MADLCRECAGLGAISILSPLKMVVPSSSSNPAIAAESHQALANCPLCGAELDRVGVRALPAYSRDHIMRCGNCGFHFSRLKPNSDDLERVYGNYDYVGEDASRSDLNVVKERAIAERLSSYRSTGNVLDIAAGAGRFLEHFRALGFRCFATEFDGRMEDYLRGKSFQVLPGGLFPQAPQDAMFDIVLFTEIIEHINIPMTVLQHIHKVLRPGGCLYITTPNFDSLERRILRSNWGMICWPEHITYWTPRHLDRAMRQAGFRRRSMVVENISPFRIVQALKNSGIAPLVGNVSEQDFSDRAQQRVASSRWLSGLKRAINVGLNATKLGSSIKSVYEKRA